MPDLRVIVTSPTTLASGPGRVVAVLLSSSAASPQTVRFYDNTAASGTVILQVVVSANGPPLHLHFAERIMLPFVIGLTVDLAGAVAQVWAVVR
jgi:hypothetical protein